MSKQICIKGVKGQKSLRTMYDEAVSYLENVGFAKTPILSLTENNHFQRIFLFSQGKEKILLEFTQDRYSEVMRLDFRPLEIEFVYDILLMRFEQLAEEDVFINS